MKVFVCEQGEFSCSPEKYIDLCTNETSSMLELFPTDEYFMQTLVRIYGENIDKLKRGF